MTSLSIYNMQNESEDFDWSNRTNTSASEIDFDYSPTPEYAIFLDSVRFWIQKVLIPITVIMGVLGNTVTIVVLTRRRMRSSTHLYLTALATSDLFYLIFNFTLSLIHYNGVKSYYGYFEYYGYGHMLTDASSNTSVWLTVSFTLERYIAVCHPIRGKVLCTESRAKFVIVGVFLFCFVSTLPTPFEYAMGTRTDSETNETLYVIGYSSLGDNATYQKVYYWFTTIFFILIPLTLIAVFNSFLIRAVHHSKQERRRMTSVRGGERHEQYSSQETKITIMLIAVVVLFLLCQVPTSIMLIYGTISEDGNEKEQAIIVSLNNICNLLMAMNASCNFVLYCAFSDRYRKTFFLTFLPCWYHPPSPIHSQSVCYKTTVTEGVMLSRSPSCRSRSPSQRSIRRTGSSRHGSTRSRGRGSFRNNSTRDSSVRTTKQNYLTVPNGDPTVSNATPQSPESPLTPESCSSSHGVSMCFQLPKGPLRIPGSSKKEEEEQSKAQTVPLQWTTTERIDFTSDEKDKLTCL